MEAGIINMKAFKSAWHFFLREKSKKEQKLSKKAVYFNF